MEGFFAPHQLQYPFDIARVLSSIVRIESHIAFVITVCDDDDLSMVDLHDTRTFLPEGVVLWQLVWQRSLLEEARVNPGLQAHPVLSQALIAFEGVTTFPTQRITRLTCPATGFFISPEGHILTNYHVVREDIEANYRTRGSVETMLCKFNSFKIPVFTNQQITSWKPLNNVSLMKNVSRADWEQGLDVALLKAPFTPPAYLPLSKEMSLEGQSIWHFGFPFQTFRHKTALLANHYSDANATLRVSQGMVNQVMEHNFIADTDSFNGSSGSPALNDGGEVIGLVWDMYPQEETSRRAEVFAGGTIYVAMPLILRHLGL